MLSLWATASNVESGLKTNARITYDALPSTEPLGFVENLSRFSPFSSNRIIDRSAVATANF